MSEATPAIDGEGVPAMCLVDFDGGGHDHALVLKRGAHLLVLNDEGTEWWYGTDNDGNEGYFPGKFIHKVDYQVPNGWKICVSHHAQVYYYNTETGESDWDLPGSAASRSVEPPRQAAAQEEEEEEEEEEDLPPGWTAIMSSNGHKYYYSTVTHQSQWEKPEGSHAPEHASSLQDDTDVSSPQGDETPAPAPLSSGAHPPMELRSHTSLGPMDGPGQVKAKKHHDMPPSPGEHVDHLSPRMTDEAKEAIAGARDDQLRHTMNLLCQGCFMQKKFAHESGYGSRFIFVEPERGLFCWARSDKNKSKFHSIPLMHVKAVVKRPPLKSRKRDAEKPDFAECTFSIITSEKKQHDIDLWTDSSALRDAYAHALLLVVEDEKMRAAGVRHRRAPAAKPIPFAVVGADIGASTPGARDGGNKGNRSGSTSPMQGFGSMGA
eukprot:CAMPEP_0118864162 /NCGR_PEP_ID=MMETSP1163-20130328/8810_1 /TAXON_ID=124430 /ORGANISM="Phaeomonas parva, Strain CCMP2877" /LENGTH=433 /DNA_ID=CAMNT_0006798233 /DNA_START=309 /DNA_END=1606 /DNA_ORIENTATION=-